jgi:hypothetical protein
VKTPSLLSRFRGRRKTLMTNHLFQNIVDQIGPQVIAFFLKRPTVRA